MEGNQGCRVSKQLDTHNQEAEGCMPVSVHLAGLILYTPGSPSQAVVPTTTKRGHFTSITIISVVPPQRYALETHFPGEYSICQVYN